MIYFSLSIVAVAIGSVLAQNSSSSALYTGSLKSQVYMRNPGWSNDRPIFVYTFDNALTGTASKIDTAPIWLFRRDGNISSTPLQNNLIDVAPGDSGYSDLWNVNIVTIPSSITMSANITSKSMLDAMISSNPSITIATTQVYVNCPVVHPDSTLQVPTDAKTVIGWYKGQPIKYFDFGPNGQNSMPPGNNNVQPVWVPVNSTGMVGNHIFPGTYLDAGYTEFWSVTLVNVPANYVADQFRKPKDWASVNANTTAVSPVKIVNCPVVGPVGDAMPFNGASASGSGGSGASSVSTTSKSGGFRSVISGLLFLTIATLC